MLSRSLRLLNSVADVTGLLIAPLTALMMLATVIVVCARYLFGIGTIPLQEAVIFMHATVLMLGTGYTLKAGDHVRVDIIYRRLSPRARAAIDLFGTLFFLMPVCLFIFWSSLDYVGLSWQMREGSAEPGGLPGFYLLKALIPTMAVLLALQGLVEGVSAGQRLFGRG